MNLEIEKNGNILYSFQYTEIEVDDDLALIFLIDSEEYFSPDMNLVGSLNIRYDNKTLPARFYWNKFIQSKNTTRFYNYICFIKGEN